MDAARHETKLDFLVCSIILHDFIIDEPTGTSAGLRFFPAYDSGLKKVRVSAGPFQKEFLF